MQNYSAYYTRYYYVEIDGCNKIKCEILTPENHWITDKIFKIEDSSTESHLCYFYDVEKLFDEKNNATTPFNIIEHNNNMVGWHANNIIHVNSQFERMIDWLNNCNVEKRMKELYKPDIYL
jgi:hypothetical protein